MFAPILVIGRGFVGSKVVRELPHAVSYDVDIADRKAVRGVFECVRPKFLINCAGKAGSPNIDWCERNKEATWRSNVEGVRILAELCAEFDCFLVQLSSGCLFRGAALSSCGWRENDQTFAPNFYLRTKLEAERIVLGFPFSIIRIRLPVDSEPHPRNTLTKICSFDFVTRGCNSITVLDDLVYTIRMVLKERTHGIIHCVSPDAVSPSHMRRLMISAGLASRNFKEIDTPELEELKLVRVARSDAILATKRLNSLGIRLDPTDRSLANVISRYGSFVT